MARGNDGIGTTVPNPEVIRDGVNRAAEAGIPVIVFNTADPNAGTDDALPTLFYIGANEFLGGRANANAVLDAADDAGGRNRQSRLPESRKLDTVAWKLAALVFAVSLKKLASRLMV